MVEASTLWADYQRTRDPALRDRLVARHMALVRHIARRMARSLPDGVEMEDLLGAGTLGLLDAIERFDPSRGLAFSTFAAPRIRGAILDDLRRWDETPRSVRQKERAIAAARESLTAAGHHEPTSVEMARKLGIAVDDLWRWERAALSYARVSLEDQLDEGDGSRSYADVLTDDGAADLDDRLEHAEILAALESAIARLPDREQLILALYYYEDLKLHQIGEVLDMTESRVCQLRKQALNTLRGSLAHLRRSA